MSENKKPVVKITRDGPYEVPCDIPLDQAAVDCDGEGKPAAWAQGPDFEPAHGQRAYYLCRCGRSKNKPFCTGEHRATGFKGQEHADRQPYTETAKIYPGPDLDLLDEPSLCVGAGFCDRGGTAWSLVAQSDDPAKKALAVEEAMLCPGGRLTAVTKTGEHLEPDLEPGISLIQDPGNNCRGPLWLKGGIQLEGADGEIYETRNRVALCRCGQSKNMPYCDSSHYKCKEMQGLDE